MTASRSLAFRLFAGAAVWALILLLLGAIALTTLYSREIVRSLDDRLVSVVDWLVAAAEFEEDGDLVLAREPSDPQYGLVFSGRYWLIVDTAPGAVGEPLIVSRSMWDEVLRLPDQARQQIMQAPGQVVHGDAKDPEGTPLRIAAQGIRLPNRPDMVIMIAAEERGPTDRAIRNFAITSGLMFLGFATAIAAGVFFQVRLGLAPVLRMRDRVADVRGGTSERVDGRYPVELQPLADELNAMLEHSRELVERSRTHVGNLAHALKTPIAVLTNEARDRDGDFPDLVARQTRVMSEQVDHHLRRARAAAHAKAIGARTPVEPVIADLGRTLMKIHANRQVRVEWRVPDGLGFRGERQDLEEMAGNLMDNACKWASDLILVSAERNAEGELVILIEDDGPGLDEAGCETALQRGVRLDERAPGTGLGLAIVADLAKAYEGQIRLSRSGLGGLQVELVLPAASR